MATQTTLLAHAQNNPGVWLSLFSIEEEEMARRFMKGGRDACVAVLAKKKGIEGGVRKGGRKTGLAN